jgi:hypothetical protein
MLVLLIVLLTGFGMAGIPYFLEGGDYFRLALIGLPGAAFVIVSFVVLIRFRVTVTSTSVVKRDLKIVTIPFDSIESIDIQEGQCIVRSENKRIELGRGVQDVQAVIGTIVRQTRDLPGIRLLGDPRWVKAHYGCEPDNE